MISGQERQSQEAIELAESFHDLIQAPSLESPENDFHNIEKIILPIPEHFPILCKRLNEFRYLNKEKEDEARKTSFFAPSCHPTNTAEYKGKKFWIKYYEPVKLPQAGNVYDGKTLLPFLELIAYLFYRRSARSIVSNQGYLLLNDQDEIVAIATEDITGFQTNRSRPLTEEDIHVEAIQQDFNHQKNLLIEELKSLTLSLKHYENDERDTYTSQTIKQVKYYWQRLSLWGGNNSVQIIDVLQSFLQEKANFSRPSLSELLKRLSERQMYVSENRLKTVTKKSEEFKRYQTELQHIEQSIKILTGMIGMDPQAHVDLSKLDEISRIAKEKNINLHSAEKVEETLASGELFCIRALDIIHIRNIEGNAICDVKNVTSYENDDHNNNRSAFGHKIDFDMNLWWFLRHMKKPNYLEEITSYFGEFANQCLNLLGWSNTSNADEDYLPEEDILTLPDMKKTLEFLRYYRSKPNLAGSFGSSFSQSRLQSLPGIKHMQDLIARIKENFYTSEDIKVSKKLASNPLYANFYKPKQFLIEIMIEQADYEKSFKIIFPQAGEIYYLDKTDNQQKPVSHVVSGQVKRMSLLSTRLTNLDEFYNFLKHYGDYVLKTIKEDCAKAKTEDLKQAEVLHEPSLKKLAELYDAPDIDRIYKNIYEAVVQAKQQRDETKCEETNITELRSSPSLQRP